MSLYFATVADAPRDMLPTQQRLHSSLDEWFPGEVRIGADPVYQDVAGVIAEVSAWDRSLEMKLRRAHDAGKALLIMSSRDPLQDGVPQDIIDLSKINPLNERNKQQTHRGFVYSDLTFARAGMKVFLGAFCGMRPDTGENPQPEDSTLPTGSPYKVREIRD